MSIESKFILIFLSGLIIFITITNAAEIDFKFSRDDGGRVFHYLTDSYYYFKNNNETKFTPSELEIELNNNDTATCNGRPTSCSGTNEISMWYRQMNRYCTTPHEYSHVVADQDGDWRQPYGPGPGHQCGGFTLFGRRLFTHDCTAEEGIGENWANLGSSLVRNDSTCDWGGGINLIFPEDTDGDERATFWENCELPGINCDPIWSFQMAGTWWNFIDENFDGTINPNEETNVNDIVYVFKYVKPQNVGEFYGGYLHRLGLTAANTPSQNDFYYPNGTVKDQNILKLACYVQDIFTRHAYDTTDWLPQDCKLLQSESVSQQSIKTSRSLQYRALSLQSFTGHYKDFITNGSLNIVVELNISAQDNYTLSAFIKTCRNCSGYVFASNLSYLSVGIQNLTLIFDGLEIYKNHLNGSYQLLDLNLYNSSGTSLRYEANPYNTSAYDYHQFRRPAVIFTGNFSEQAIDINNDTKYEFLRIVAGVNVTDAGNYSISGFLADANETGVASTDNYVNLAAGVQNVSLDFDGKYISDSKKNGPYILKQLSVYTTREGVSFPIYSEDFNYSTGAYNYTDFQLPKILFINATDYAIDNNSNGLYDYFAVRFLANVTESGNYSLRASLFGDRIIGHSENLSYLNAGLQNISLIFASDDLIEKQFTNGTIEEVAAYDLNGSLVGWQNPINTKKYNISDFEVHSSKISFVMKDYGLDIDDDSAYEYVVVDIPILIKDYGNYTLTGYLHGNSLFTGASNISVLDNGLHSMRLLFDSKFINESGSYKLRNLVLENNGTGELLSIVPDAYATSYYNISSFREPKAAVLGDYSDYALDVNNNSLYDYLAVSFMLNASEAGNYTLYGHLSRDGMYITGAATNKYIDSGLQNLTLYFDGRAIKNIGLNGPYQLSLIEIYENGSFVSKNMPNHMTSNYTFSQFEYMLIGNETELLFRSMIVAKINNTIFVNTAIRNKYGTAIVIKVDFYDKNNNLLKEKLVDYLEPGAIKNTSFSTDSNSTLIRAVIDPYNEIAESREDNNQFSRTILSGDVNNDCTVNIFDLATVGLMFGSNENEDRWNLAVDVTGDGKINIFDLAAVGLNFGKSC